MVKLTTGQVLTWIQYPNKRNTWGSGEEKQKGGKEKNYATKASFEAIYDLAHSWYALSLK